MVRLAHHKFRKKDLIASFIIGEVCALIFLVVLRFLELPEFVIRTAKLFPVVLPILSISGTYAVSVLGKKWPTLFQWSKSFLIGILNSFIDLGILNYLMWFSQISSGSLFSVFKGFSFICATINSYFWNKFWAFEKKETEKRSKEMVGFFSVAGAGFLIHLSVTTLLVNVVGPQFGISEQIWANLSAIVAIFFGFSWNFFGYKFLVFKK